MNKWTVGIIIALIATSAYFLLGNAKEPVLPVKEGPIVIFGDSLVYGIGASKGHDIASLLEGRLGMPVINAGRPGDTTGSAKGRLVSDVMVHNPGVVVVILGGNDVLRRMPKEETLQNMRDIVGQIQSAGTSVVLVGISNMVYSKEYGDIARDMHLSFIPRLLDKTLGHEELMSDAIHPNDKGYEIFAESIEAELKKLQNS